MPAIALDQDTIFPAICEDVSKGMLAQEACEKHGIAPSTLWRWCDADETMRTAYAHARVLQCHVMAEDCVRIADGLDAEAQARLEVMADVAAKGDDEDAERLLASLQAAAIQRDRLRLDARKWLTSKIAPRIYGEKLDVAHEVSGEVVVRVEREGRRNTAG